MRELLDEKAAERETPQTFAALMSERHRLQELAMKVAEMRTLQKKYFVTRGKLALAYAMDAEKEIDTLIKEILPNGSEENREQAKGSAYMRRRDV